MLHLLRIEWMKIKNYRTFWILSILYLVSIYGLNFIVYRFQQNLYEKQQTKGIANLIVGTPPYSFPTVWQMTSFVSSFLLIMPALMLIISITNEYSFKTHRQNIIDGLSRTQFISVKLVLAVIISIVSTIMVFITAYSFGLQFGGIPFSLDKSYYLGYYFLQALSYCGAAILISILLKRSGIAIGVFFLYSTVFENVAAGLLNKYADYTGRYLPIESADVLIPLPAFKQVQKQFFTEPNYTYILIAVFIYLAIYVIISKWRYEKSDL